jgi:hypothetical protein
VTVARIADCGSRIALKRRRACFLAPLAAAVIPRALRSQEIEILTLRYRTAEQVLPLLQPFVEPGGALTGRGNQLFLRTTRTNGDQIRRLLVTLDRAPRQLLITVRQDAHDDRATRELRADGSVTIGTRRSFGNIELRGDNGRSIGTRSATQSVRVLEGGRASIALATAVPFTFRQWTPTAQGGWVATDQTVYDDAVTGFVVEPRVDGDTVTLDIAPEQAAYSGSTVDRHRLATTVRGRLGEWISLGATDAGSEAQASGVLRAETRAISAQRGVWLRVDEAGGGAADSGTAMRSSP